MILARAASRSRHGPKGSVADPTLRNRLTAREPAAHGRELAGTGAERMGPYTAKRDFAATPEPQGQAGEADGNRFCVQKHDARRLHYDLRLELDGVLKSWAVTRGPSLVPGEKRLAVHTEDHPIEYLAFEGVIPKGEYGGGTMILWDQGQWTPESDPHKGYAKGHLDFTLQGERLKGRWHLVRMRPRPREKKEQWLLLKGDDEYARAPAEPEITEEITTSILSGRTNADLAQAGDLRTDHAARERAGRQAACAGQLAKLAGAKKDILPAFLEPSLATLADTAPEGAEWIHEIKLDGYRLQARIEGDRVKLLTRKGLDWTAKFSGIAQSLRALKLGSALIDGEVVVEDEAGVSSFTGLQEALKSGRSDRMLFYAFDLLYLDGYDLTRVPLIDRKILLAGCLDDVPAHGAVRYSEHLERSGAAMFRHACRLGLEGIVSKRKDLPYRAGRGPHWLKVKCMQRQEFVIAGYVPSTTSRKAVGSLVLGVHEGGRLVHVGRVGTGFTEAIARDLWTVLDASKRSETPFAQKVPAEAARGVRWLEPKLVAEVELRGWTTDGLLRHASFKGLRDDKDAAEVVREAAARSFGKAALCPTTPTISRLTHPDRVLWPDVGLTKQGLAEYYADIAGWALPHLADRPLSLVRCPSGVGKDCFFQKHAWEGIGSAIGRRTIQDEDVLFIRDLEGLVALAQAGVLEIHPWGSTIGNPERPDRITIDLDPGEDVAWTALIEGACEVRERLRALGLESFVKTTGGKGLHVVVPLMPRAEWDEVKRFAQELADAMARDTPQQYVATSALRERKGRLSLDFLRTGRGAPAVGPSSPRARAGAPVSPPLGWDELSPNLRPSHFTVDNLPTRLRHLAQDPWADIGRLDQVLPGGSSARRTRRA